MHYHRLVVAYKGTHYFGWQDLGEQELKPTVQGSIERVLQKICHYRGSSVAGASRTDGGVHARGQVVKLSITLKIDSAKLQHSMNSLLPDDIRVLHCEPSSARFNPNRDCKSKEYHYYFSTNSVHNPLLNDFVVPMTAAAAPTDDSFDIELMRQGCRLFMGEHDFQNFARRDANIGSTLRTVSSCEILPAASSGFGDNIYYLRIVGDGFLRNMIRYIVGALFALEKKQLTLSAISAALSNRQEGKVSARAKARGLHLQRIEY